jgi:hypothetical protein
LDKLGEGLLKKIEQKDSKDRTDDEKNIREIQVHSLCILIQLCYRAENIKKIERYDALSKIRKMEEMKWAN